MSAEAERATLLKRTRTLLPDLLGEPGSTVKPSSLMRELQVGWNVACGLLEYLEKAGELVRVQGDGTLTWAARQRPAASGSLLHLSAAEHEALCLLLASTLEGEPLPPRTLPYLRGLQDRLKELRHG